LSVELPELSTLIRLIDDPDPLVHEAVTQELVLRGPDALATYHGIIDTSSEPIVRQNLLNVVHRIQRAPLDQLAMLMSACAANSRDVDLEQAVVLLDRFGLPAGENGVITKYLDDAALRIHEEFIVKAPASDLTQLLSMHTVLFEQDGFRGALDDYYDPQNSYLSSAISRREGIPVTLAVVELLVAERIGLELFGVAMPMHFLLYSRQLDVYIDPYHHGLFLSREDCVSFITRHGIEFSESMLRPVTNSEIVIRMIRNLTLAHEKHLEMWESQILHHTLQSLDPTTHS
jgi:regulator of sirC expression with transglutaminase-like and TPR domain